ncbi:MULTISPECIES: alanine--tRNA ligase [Halocynthiibacter]|uniref:Alanine--tRNA ligase n=1 Tax=Halocynthiibacter halioticoli TaxID=2986804 RepID=A0AAE3LUJ9_9RHOB|nr:MULTISPECIES: alanine--tRNA ligase [Halocynthiibacter]MCV6824460.1 alanine--tRNA ligase [Halocynthiibacter halioticoli]MCW4057461.1 alanine--tRNA ligase [Halocynthiibacter sp. SDUM655004]
MPSLNDIRSTYLDYFKRNGHAVVDSSPLVPRNDPTLMFTNAGMVQFKNVFTGVEHRDYTRATTSQKCVRAGGKHNDLDNVGYTARHHTFFEMLGNFSFGDYFKEDAIPFAWDLLTKDFGLDKDKLLVTVYHTDDEAANIWKKHAGLSDDRIIRIATDDNFWSMGATGPCGPCTEIFYDHGDHIWGGPPGSPEEDGDRFIEIWNLVFMQFEQQEDGTRLDLPKPSIDTGMGLERIAALLQGTHDNYETDLFKHLIEASASVTGQAPYGDKNVHHRVIADHLRSTSFLIADGVMPSNEGRGYVLRRIMRRAMRHAHLLGATRPVMHELVPALVSQMGAAYPELSQGQAMIEETLKLEEERFRQTLDRGLKLLDNELDSLPEGADLPGESAFKLYDTYGFPLDLTQDALRERGRGVEVEGFDKAMENQKAMARAAWSGSGETADAAIWFELADEFGATEFLGYDTEIAEGQILAIVADGEKAETAAKDARVQLVTNQTPFYAESGGQVGDSGTIKTDSGSGKITDTRKVGELFLHSVTVTSGELAIGQGAELEVDHARRSAIRANHTATHLLHEALRQRLGDHVAQRGSLNAADRLRFDFSHGKALEADDLEIISDEVNAYIRQNTPVETRIMTPDDARALGAQALFGEKYGDEVRVVSMGYQDKSGKGLSGNTYSLELCGGTHVKRTGDIGAFVLLSDGASSAGVRRIEALTGEGALAYIAQQNQCVGELTGMLKAQPDQVAGRVKGLLDDRKALQNEIAQLRRELAVAGAGDAAEPKDVNGTTLLAQVLSGVGGKDLPDLIAQYKSKIGSGVVLLIADSDGKAAVAAGVTDDLAEKLSAVDLVRAAVGELGGKGGGGRPTLAQGGGKDASNSDAAIKAVEAVIGG